MGTLQPSAVAQAAPSAAVEPPSTAEVEPPSTAAVEPPSTASTESLSTAATEPPSTAATEPPSTAAVERPSSAAVEPPSTAVVEPSSTPAVEPPSTAAAQPEMSKTERRLYINFFENLGINDDKATAFLATLLRNVFEASSKLDAHLAPHGACLHSAVSRMQVSENPRDAPTHRWIRLVDRIGLFSDNDAHAVRIMNLALSFAWRHVELDAIAKANALILGEMQQTVDVAVATNKVAAIPRGGVDLTPVGGGGVGGATGDEAGGLPPIDDPMQQGDDDEECALPDGGMAFLNVPPPSGLANGGDPAGGLSASALTTSTTLGGGRTTTGGGQETPLPAGGIEINLDHAPLSGAGQDPDETDEDAGQGGHCPPHVIHDRQPTVVPTNFSVETVTAVLTGLQDRADGIAVLRQLLDDSVLVLGRSSARPTVKWNGKPFPTGIRGDRMALGLRTDKWWPQWHAPQDLDKANSFPPAGTIAHAFNRHRPTGSSRWVILVDMTGINDVIKALSVRSARFFPKNALVQYEMVSRIWGKAPMRLPVVVACMLLLVTKEEEFGVKLAHLAAAGRAAVPTNAPLLSASCHEFNTSGLAAPDAATGPSNVLPGGHGSAAPLPLLPDGESEEIDDRYAEMDVVLANEASATKTQNRANRIRARTAKAHSATATGASSAPRSAAHASPTTRRPPARSRAQAAGALAPRPVIKKARAAHGNNSAAKTKLTRQASAAIPSRAAGAAVDSGPAAVGAGAAAADGVASPHVRLVVAPPAVAPPTVMAANSQPAHPSAVYTEGPVAAAAVYGVGQAPPAFAVASDGTVVPGAQAPTASPALNTMPNGGPVAYALPGAPLPCVPNYFSPSISTGFLLPGALPPHSAAALAPVQPHPSASDFAEEQRLRRERVEANLRDAHASVSEILSSRHESWGGGGSNE